MEKFTLSLNSHALTNFQKCPTAFAYSELLQIQPAIDKEAFRKGTEVGRVLNCIHYLLKRYKPKTEMELKKKVFRPTLPYTLDRFLKHFDVDNSKKYSNAILKYVQTYDLLQMKVVAVEAGFSKIIHEDDENLFIYEGRPDIVIMNGENEIVVGDNKTQAYQYDIYPFNNQAIGYLWGTGAKTFFYNYLTLSSEPEVRRDIFPFSNDQIESWKEETIRWFFRAKSSIQNKEFPMSRFGCTDKYGKCDFYRLCEYTNYNMKNWIMRSEFKKKPKHKSW